MDIQKFEQAYKELAELSEYGADIYANERYTQMLQDDIKEPQGSFISGITRMQLAEERLQQFNEHISPENGEEVLEEGRRYIYQCLSNRLSFCSVAEQNGYLLGMLGKAFEVLGEPLSEKEVAQLSHESTEVLKNQVIDAVERISMKIIMETDMKEVISNIEPEEKSEGLLVQSMASASAAACYLCDAEMRKKPEMIGMTSAAAEICSQHKMETALEITALMLFEMAGSMTLSVLFTSIPGAVAAMFVTAAESGAAITLASFVKEFISCITYFSLALKIAAGIGAASMIVAAALKLVQWMNKDSEWNQKDEFIAENPNVIEEIAPSVPEPLPDFLDEEDENENQWEDA